MAETDAPIGRGNGSPAQFDDEEWVDQPNPSDGLIVQRKKDRTPPRKRRERVSRWDRGPEPHDWRWIVGHIGRALITLGLLMFGFVAYQLWGTGIQTARAQEQLKNEFEAKIAALPLTPDTIGPPTDTTVPAVASSGDTVPGEPTTVPAVTPTTVPTAPLSQDYGAIGCGDGIGRISIPKINVTFFYVACVGNKELAKGVGHFPQSVVPGQLGNAALAGHRTTYKAPFYDLDHLHPGDEIDIETILGGAYVYVVTGSETVDPSDYHVVTDSDPTRATLTLITCTPIRTSSHRLVIHADLVATRSSPVGLGQVNYGQTDPNTSLGEGTLPDDGLGTQAATTPTQATTTTVALGSAPSPLDPITSTTASTTVVGSSPHATTPTTPPLGIDPAIDRQAEFTNDAFQQGWFDDSAAIPHVAAWLALFALVWYGAYRVAKRFRNMWLGVFVGFGPILVTLYFAYENVNRLLPAAI